MVTSGRVCTFLGRDRATLEQAVIWTFECSGNAVELDTASIVARFCTLAPNPPGILVTAGSDDQSSTAFIACRMPAAELDAWVRSYQSFSSKPRSDAPPPAPRPRQNPPPSTMFGETSNPASTRPGATPGFTSGVFRGEVEARKSGAGEFTSFFRSPFDQPAASAPIVPDPRGAGPAKPDGVTGVFSRSELERGVSSPPSAPESGQRPSSGSFTQMFGPGGSPLGSTPSNPISPAAPFSDRTSVPQAPGSFTQIFGGAASPSAPDPADRYPAPSAPFSEPASTPQAPGSFTQIFGGGASPSAPNPTDNYPAAFSEPASAPQTPGSFTQIFGGGPPSGTGNNYPASSPFSEPVTAPQAPGSFTQVFGGAVAAPPGPPDNPAARSPFPEPISAPPARPIVAAPVMPAPAPLQPDPFAPRPIASVAAPQVSPIFPPSEPRSLPQVPVADPTPVEKQPRKPSEFTMFMDRSQLRAMLQPEAQGVAAPPPTPPVPVAKPLAPVRPAPPAPAASGVPSYLPLITGLVVLLAIAALLVMYFVMKH